MCAFWPNSIASRMQNEWKVTPEEAGVKLVSFLQIKLGKRGHFSGRALKKRIEQNGCRINGRPERFASTSLAAGDIVTLDSFSSQLALPIFDLQRVLYQDDLLLVYNKPPGITCDEKGILAQLRMYERSLQLVHRLDKDTTGLLILAKSEAVRAYFVGEFKQFQVGKSYLALVEGRFKEKKGSIENALGPQKTTGNQVFWKVVEAQAGLYAYTDWEVVQNFTSSALVRCFPKTGRTHQLRVHMASLGHPIIGDQRYNHTPYPSVSAPRCLLHAESVRFRHPKKGLLEFFAPLPSDFEEVLKELK